MPLTPYAPEHATPNGPGDARPSALKIIQDQNLGPTSLAGKVFFITGCTSGIGLETARAIRATGADVYFTGRGRERGLEVEGILSKSGTVGKAVFIQMDMESLEGVRVAAAEFLRLSTGKLNVLICNAGIRGYPKSKTKDGYEQHFGINHLAHFALFQALKDALLDSSTSTFASRVITVSASGHRQSRIRFHDYNFDHHPEDYAPLRAYAQSKTANIYMALEIERRFASQGLHGLAVHPGGIAETALNRMTPAEEIAALTGRPEVAVRLKSAGQGAATTVWAAVAREWEGKGGRFLEDCQESEAWDGDGDVLAPGYGGHVYDEESAARLWEESLQMIH